MGEYLSVIFMLAIQTYTTLRRRAFTALRGRYEERLRSRRTVIILNVLAFSIIAFSWLAIAISIDSIWMLASVKLATKRRSSYGLYL